MIGSSLRIFFLGIGSLFVSWAAFLLVQPFAGSAVRAEESWYFLAFPHPRIPGGLGAGNGFAVTDTLSYFLPFEIQSVRSLQELLNRRAKTSFRVLPLFLVSITGSVIAALLVRERLRFGTGYASPTVSFLAKRVAEASIVVFVLLTFSPFPLPYWAFYPALGAAALGSFGYVANLPLRL